MQSVSINVKPVAYPQSYPDPAVQNYAGSTQQTIESG